MIFYDGERGGGLYKNDVCSLCETDICKSTIKELMFVQLELSIHIYAA